MPLTEKALAAIKDELAANAEAYRDLSDEQVVALLHEKPEVRTPQEAKPKRLSVADFIDSLSAESCAALAALPVCADLLAKIAVQDRAGVAIYASLLGKAGVFAKADTDAITAMLNATEAQPDVVTLGKSRFEIALKYVPEMPNKIRPDDIATARA